MFKKFISIMALAFCVASCSASSNSDAKAETEGAGDQPATEITPANALMVTKDIPANSKKVEVQTTAGNFTVLLYGDTPLHRDNFLKLVEAQAYDSLLFHRVINEFMVQAGDPQSKNAPAGTMLGGDQIGEQIPAEIVFPRHFHKRGALAAARTSDQVNPERKSSGSQFYIVTGKVYTPEEMNQMNMQLQYSVAQQHFNNLAQEHKADILRMQAENDSVGLRALQEQLAGETEEWIKSVNIGYTPEMVETYTTIGGTPHLDNQYTVYGEVIDGMDVIDKIQKVKTDGRNRPLEDVRIITMKVLDD